MDEHSDGTITFVADCDDTLVNSTRDLRGQIERVEKHLTPVLGVHAFYETFPYRNWCVSLTKNGDPAQVAKLVKFDLLKYFPSPRLQLCATDDNKKEKIKWIAEQITGCKVYIEDRLDFLAVGKRCGFITVRMRLKHGKYASWKPRNSDQIPDYTVKNWSEVLRLPIVAEALARRA